MPAASVKEAAGLLRLCGCWLSSALPTEPSVSICQVNVNVKPLAKTLTARLGFRNLDQRVNFLAGHKEDPRGAFTPGKNSHSEETGQHEIHTGP